MKSTCLNCGSEYITKPCRIVSGNTCCSNKCKAEYRRKNNNYKDRFWGRVEKTSGCWIWKGSTLLPPNLPYGRFKINGIEDKAHRISFIFANGEIPEGNMVLHHCDNPRCVNPNHLYAGTHIENARDRVVRGRSNPARQQPKIRGENHCNARLTWELVRQIREKYKRGVYGKMRLAKEYSVSKTTIDSIIRDKTWIR